MPNVGYATLQIIPSVRGIADDLRRQLVGPAGSAGGDAGQAAGSGLKDKLKVGAAAAGAAAGALLVAGISEAMDQANITSTLQAQLGTSNKVAAAQGKVAGKLYSSGVSESFQDAAEAIKSVVQSGLAPPDATNAQLQQIATKASDVANVFGQDLGGVTNAVSQMMRTGLAKNANEAFDLVTAGFQSGTDKAGDFLDTLNEYGTQFRKAGIAGPQAIGLINQALKAGARDGDLAADAIKEFGIRAVDGSTSTAQGFNALGLSGKKMAAGFAKGGATANAVLDVTLDRLRGIKDPVQQSRIAVALFGTQAEDLGKALFAMDPSSAAKGLGAVGGAADKVGKSIRSGPTYEIEVFTRALKQGFVDFIGGQVLPTVATLAHGLNTYLLPPLRIVGSVLAATVIPALVELWQGGAAVVKWLRDMGTWLIPITIAVGGFTAAILAQQIATAAVAAVFSIYRGAILAWTTVQKAATIAQAAFNAVMNANPVILVITAIVALAAAMYVAYQRSETFRAIVQAAFQGVKTVALAVYGWFAGPFVTFFVKTIPAAFNAVLSWVRTNWPWILGALTGPIGLATVYIIKHWGDIKSGIGAAWSWIKTNVLSPIGVWFTQTVPGWATSLKNHVVGAFDGARAGIKAAWDKIKAITKAPVQFVVDTVYNNGIRKVWNLVTGAFGGTKLAEMKFAEGGILPGYTPGRDVHSFYSPTAGYLGLSGGEAIMRPEVTRALGVSGVNSLNAAARSGGVSGVRSRLGFAGGGIFGGIGSALSGAWDKIKKGASWLKDTFGGAIRSGVQSVVSPLINSIPGGAGFSGLLKSGMRYLVDRLLGAGVKGDKLATPKVSYRPSAGVEQWRPVVLQALREVGQSASLANTTLRRMNQESGGNPTIVNKTDSNWLAGHPSVGLMQVIGPTFRSFAGKYRGTGPFSYGVSTNPLANVYASMKYALGAYGSLSRAYDRAGGYDSGGWLQPGVTRAVNATRQPEAVLTASQWQVMSAAARAGGSRPVVIEVHARDQALADFIDVRVQDHDQALISVITAS